MRGNDGTFERIDSAILRFALTLVYAALRMCKQGPGPAAATVVGRPLSLLRRTQMQHVHKTLFGALLRLACKVAAVLEHRLEPTWHRHPIRRMRLLP